MYTVGDFITRLKNAALAHRVDVVMPYSKMCETVAKILKKEGFIEAIQTGRDKRDLTVYLAYHGNEPVLTGTKIVSKPGLRIYRKVKQLGARVTNVLIVTTPLGIMTGKEAQKKNIGGELIAEVW